MSIRVAAFLGAAVGGFGSGLAVVVLHQSWVWLVLALVAAVAAMAALGPGSARVGFAVAWALVVLRGALTRPEGDYLVPANTRGWTLLAASLALVLAAFATARQGGGSDGVQGEQPTPT